MEKLLVLELAAAFSSDLRPRNWLALGTLSRSALFLHRLFAGTKTKVNAAFIECHRYASTRCTPTSGAASWNDTSGKHGSCRNHCWWGESQRTRTSSHKFHCLRSSSHWSCHTPKSLTLKTEAQPAVFGLSSSIAIVSLSRTINLRHERSRTDLVTKHMLDEIFQADRFVRSPGFLLFNAIIPKLLFRWRSQASIFSFKKAL